MENLNDFARSRGGTNVAAFLAALDPDVRDQLIDGWKAGVRAAVIVRWLKQEAGVADVPTPNTLGNYLRKHYP